MANRRDSLKKDTRKSSSRLFRMLKLVYYRFIRLRGTPEKISLGLSLGIFIGMTPFLGAHTLIAVALASLFKWSKITAAIGVMITNPFTAPLIYPVTYKLGAMVTAFSSPSQWSKIFEPDGVIGLMKSSPMIFIDLIVGGVLIGLPLSLVSYYLTMLALSRARRRLKIRKARRALKRAALKKAIEDENKKYTESGP
ncbi:MAG: DUF2062 domain-containing protein [Desulfobacteraceae bacterium]